MTTEATVPTAPTKEDAQEALKTLEAFGRRRFRPGAPPRGPGAGGAPPALEDKNCHLASAAVDVIEWNPNRALRTGRMLTLTLPEHWASKPGTH